MCKQMIRSAALVAALALCLPGCGGGESFLAFHGETMGTTWTVKVIGALDQSGSARLESDIQKTLDGVNGAMSTYRDDSELSRFNAAEGGVLFALTENTREVFRIALEVYRQSGGAFDVTVGPLVNAWGFGPEDRAEPPSERDAECAACALWAAPC